MTTTATTAALRPSGFFVMRAPLLPLEELDRLRTEPGYWRTLIERPEVREALHLASPGLMRRVADGDPDDRVIASVTAYLARMCTRSTPFGLFAGCALGTVGDATSLAVDGPDGITRHTRPDTEVLATLVERLLADPATQQAMTVEPNSSRYHAAGSLRLIESRVRDGRRAHHLVAIEDDAPLRCALEVATGGARVAAVVDAVAAHTGAAPAQARDYVAALIDAKVLTPVAEPAVTGAEPLGHVLSWLGDADFAPTAEALQRVSDELARLDAAGIGNAPEEYAVVTAELLRLAGDGDEARAVQVDLHRNGAGLTLGPEVIRLLTDGVALLHRVSAGGEHPAMARFKTEFAARYEDREVPLMEALDEEMGIGFDRSMHPAADDSPLLRGMDLGGVAVDGVFTARDAALLDLLMRSRESGSASLELDAAAVERLAGGVPLPLPDALAVNARVLEDGVEIDCAYGPSGAELLGRFCHGDSRLQGAVRAHLRAEESHSPGVVFAEIIHLPEGRVGNVLARPVLRDHELILLGRSGAPADHQLTVDELTVRLEAGRVVLHSPRLQAEVRPRLTTAHNPAWRGFGVYRFLAALAGDGVAGHLAWEWGALSGSPALPRVTSGRLVLARARWRFSADEIARVTGRDAASGWADLSRRRGLPRELLIVDGDNRLYVDTASAALVAAAAKVLKGRDTAVIEEVLGTDGRVAAGPAGRFAHEVIVPFLRAGAPDPGPSATLSGWKASTVQRTFAPGSQWLYLKAYTGTASTDRILTGTVGPVLRGLRQAGTVDSWFFLRYADPEHHLRLRLHGDPVALRDHALPALTDALAPRLGDGTVWKVVLDTYHRETERYGGDHGIELAERIHAADSEAVVRVLGLLDGVSGEDAADIGWKLCLYATDRLLTDAGFDLPQRRDWARAGVAGYRPEYPNAPDLDPGIGSRWRTERSDLARLLDDGSDHPYEAARRIFRERSLALVPLFAELRHRADCGALTTPFEDVVHSVSHLNAVRLLRSAARTHELVLLNFLDRHYASRIAMQRNEKSVSPRAATPSYM
ncbi:lantibiotic dehydratase [Mycolicibacterium fluoranthenivorans]|uniref:Thiopeptide-type bacteriocin biosynthesis domain-containing protein n=1 Tax=Mycolicibacterium fluoranthenivorans TaxID=258505 RepID=A0A1G4X0U1_9MYCO|nr:lantibiotic dehydratase [Mycolicibacterium fluoranthenivorans]SCX33559.1 thiopeptide-type bacteriocin biosynthesis domain-containing protein [Mycolicibacterium fluoranthenivorans]